MAEPLPPGPAFIPAMNNNCGWTRTGQDCSICREWHDVPLGYIWRPATNGTMAGWCRPSGGDRPPGYLMSDRIVDGTAIHAPMPFGPENPPYPFCRTPDRCAGKGYCPRDPACNE